MKIPPLQGEEPKIIIPLIYYKTLPFFVQKIAAIAA
jgi:hypothetical protein